MPDSPTDAAPVDLAEDAGAAILALVNRHAASSAKHKRVALAEDLVRLVRAEVNAVSRVEMQRAESRIRSQLATFAVRKEAERALLVRHIDNLIDVLPQPGESRYRAGFIDGVGLVGDLVEERIPFTTIINPHVPAVEEAKRQLAVEDARDERRPSSHLSWREILVGGTVWIVATILGALVYETFIR